MLEAGGIDKLVNQKADAYRSNPQALKQRYSQNQELMDLLAMQKLKTEKETVARDMALKAEQTPGTIAEQYEQQLVSMNKDQMAQQTAGILGERQKKAQQKSQSMGMPPQQPQGQRPPMPQGAPQGIASQPRPNMQGMAQGGIVGYQAGGKLSRRERALKALGITEDALERMSPDQKKVVEQQIQSEYVKQRKEFTVPEMPISKVVREAQDPEIQAAKREDIRRRMNPTAEEKAQDGLGNLLADKELLAGEEEDMTRIAAATATAPTTAPAATAAAPTPATDPTTGGVATLPVDPSAGVNANLERVGLDVDSLTATPDTSGISRKQVTEALAGTGVLEGLKKDIATDPTQVQKDEIARMSSDDKDAGGFDRAGQKAMYDKYLGEKETLDAKALSPAEVEKRRRRKAIQGFMSEGTSRGTGIAQAKFDDDLAKSRQGSILQRLSIEKQGMDNDVKIATAINEEAGRALGRAMDARSKAMTTVSNLAADDISMYNAEANRMYTANQNGIKNKIDALRVDTEARLQSLIQSQASAAQIGTEIARLEKEGTDLREVFFAQLGPEIAQLRSKERREGLTGDEIKLLAGYEAQFQQLKEKTRMDDTIDMYRKMLKQEQGGYSNQIKSGTTSTTGTTSGATSTQQAQVAAKANSYIQP